MSSTNATKESKKRKRGMRYTLDLLEHISKEYNAKLTKQYYSVLLTRNSEIEFICSCGMSMKKQFRYCLIGCGMICKECMLKNKKSKKIKSH